MRFSIFYLLFFITLSTFSYAERPKATEIPHYERKLALLVNKERMKRGLPLLKTWKLLYEPAIEHSKRMAKGKVTFGHHGFEKRAEKVSKKAKISSFGENLAYCLNVDDPLMTSVTMWMKSKSHRENLLDPNFTDTMIAIALDDENGMYITQLFAKRL